MSKTRSKPKPKSGDDRLVMTPNGKKRWGFLKRVLDRWEHSIDAFKAIAKKPHSPDCPVEDDGNPEACDCHVSVAIDWLRDAGELPSDQQHESHVSVYAHRVLYRWWDIPWYYELEGELAEELEEAAEGRIKECLEKGFHSGDLTMIYHDPDRNEDHELSGWWEIDN